MWVGVCVLQFTVLIDNGNLLRRGRDQWLWALSDWRLRIPVMHQKNPTKLLSHLNSIICILCYFFIPVITDEVHPQNCGSPTFPWLVGWFGCDFSPLSIERITPVGVQFFPWWTNCSSTVSIWIEEELESWLVFPCYSTSPVPAAAVHRLLFLLSL